MNIDIEFNKVYYPGEDAPPSVQAERFLRVDLEALPRYKDQITFGNHKYVVHDVIFALGGPKNYLVRAMRTVSYDEFRQ